MSIRVMSQVWDCGPTKQGALLVMLALADYANDAGECWPSIKSIAEKARMTERGVQKILRSLEADGWLKIDTGNGRHGCNKYTINPEPCSPPEQRSPRTSVQETPNVDAETPNVDTPEPSEPSKEPSVKRRTRIREDAEISDRQVEIAHEAGHTTDEAVAQFHRFKNSAIANGRTYLNWDAAWRNWFNSPYFKPITYGGRNDRTYGTQNEQRRDPALEQISRLAGLEETPGYGRG